MIVDQRPLRTPILATRGESDIRRTIKHLDFLREPESPQIRVVVFLVNGRIGPFKVLGGRGNLLWAYDGVKSLEDGASMKRRKKSSLEFP
jgi:hypothetical protein